jgi:hypothetical protein
MIKVPRDWHDVRNATLDTGGRDDIPRPKPRARGGRTEMRPSGGADVDHDQLQRSRRAADGSRSSKSVHVAGETAKHRVDRATRRKQKKLASGGTSGGASAMPYGGGGGYVPVVALPTARFSAPAVTNNQPDYTQSLVGLLGKDFPKGNGQGLISGIKLPGGGTVGDATQDFFQDIGDWRGGAVRKRSGVRADISPKRGGRVRQHHRQHKGK